MRIGIAFAFAARTTSATLSGPPMLPGLMRTAATPCSIAFSARLALKWMSAMIGTGEKRTILLSASASSVFGTATRTISQPALTSSAICAVVAGTSCVFVVVNALTTTKTHDVPATTAQIAELVSAGCEIVRVAVPKTEDAEALSKIVRFSPVPIIADIHFNASLALKAIEQGVAAVRINPGNIGGPDKVAEVVRAAKAKAIPMRIGANSGSLPKHLEEIAHRDQAEALVEAALEEVRLLESLDYYDFKISVKSSHVPTMIRAYRMLSERVPYPLHLGVTEAGTVFSGSIKSAVGIGTLLAEGIGDTIRVSLSADPVEEPKTAFEILKALGLRERGPVMIACPSCGRDNVGVHTLAEQVEARLQSYPQAFEVAVLGCAVNGPGESGDADFGIAGGRDVGFIYAHGRVLKKVSSDILIDELFFEIDKWIAEGMHRPKRLKMAKPAALAMAEASAIPLE